ncbi:MAG TPA: DUF4397 domain-containing protein [Ktedonobacteraceae bacterium]|nr:DUF4397 domain-containing protein [Ktedonobacteraceae bacterium]
MNLKCFGGKVVLRGLSLLGVLALLACFVIFSSSAASAAPPSFGFARIIHAAPSAGNVDVFVDGMKLPASIAFGTVTAYAPVPAGAHRIQIAPAGKGAGAAMIDRTVTIAPQTAYTLAALGTTATGFSLNTFVDNNLLVGGGNMAKMRVYHLSPDAGPINLTTGGKTVIAGLAYPDASDYLTMPAGTPTFSAAATQSGTRVAVPATLQPGTVTSIFAIGLLNGTPALQFVTATVPAVPARAMQAEPVGHV